MKPFVPVGFQSLVNTMRNDLHSRNVLIVDGAGKAERLSGLPLLTDPEQQYGLAYGVHTYGFASDKDTWNQDWAYLAATHAVLSTEWSYAVSDCGKRSQTVAPQFLDYMRHTANVGVLAHALDEYGTWVMNNPALDPTTCPNSDTGPGYAFLHNYMDTFSN